MKSAEEDPPVANGQGDLGERTAAAELAQEGSHSDWKNENGGNAHNFEVSMSNSASGKSLQQPMPPPESVTEEHDHVPPVAPSHQRMGDTNTFADPSALMNDTATESRSIEDIVDIDQLDVELREAERKVELLKQRAKKQKELAISRKKEELRKDIAVAEQLIKEKQEKAAAVRSQCQELASITESFAMQQLRDDEERWSLEKKLRFDDISRQEALYKNLAKKRSDMSAALEERNLWVEAIEEHAETSS